MSTEALESRILLAAVTAQDPLANSHHAPVTTDVSATYDEAINAGTATPQNFVVRSHMSPNTATVSAVGNTITADPVNDFFPGEQVQVTSTAGVQGTTAGVTRVWQFRADVTAGSGIFQDSGQNTGMIGASFVTFGDVDGDGDVDALEAGTALSLNDGTGVFTDTGQRLGAGGETEFGDIDGDGDLDVVGTNGVHLNNGSGVFTNTNQALGGGLAIEIGDLDGDGDLDAMRGIAYTGNRVLFNDGNGTFTDSGQALGNSSSQSIEFADFDGDGDLDAFSANNGAPNRIWTNDGNGIFTASGQTLGGFSTTIDVDLGDFDGDGDVDAIEANNPQGNIGSRVWLNDGSGVLTDTGQNLGPNENNWTIEVGDVDNDGDLDAVVGNLGGDPLGAPSRIWLNDGSANFSDSGQAMVNVRTYGMDIADIDGDGDLDIWFSDNSQPSRVWINQNPQPDVTLAIDATTITESAGTATITATIAAAFDQPITADLSFSGTATNVDDFTATSTQIVIPIGSTSGSISVTAVQDPLDEPDETLVIDIASIVNGQQAGGAVTTTIIDDDDPPTVDLSVDTANIGENGGVATATATLSTVSGQDVVVDLAVGGSATAGTDYNLSATQITIAAGATSGTATVTSVDDPVDEPNETVDLTITATNATVGVGAQSVTINDDDDPPTVTLTVDNENIPENGGIATFTATLSATALAAVTVDLGVSGSATQTTDYTLSETQISIAPGSTSGSVTVTSVADVIITEGPETVTLDIIAVSANATESGDQSATTTIVDDVNGPDVTLTASAANMAEAGGEVILTATLANIFSLPVTVDFGFAGTATQTTDFTASASSITIPADSTTGTITLTAVQDTLPEAEETVVAEIINVINGNEAGGQQAQTITINDDDDDPTVVLSVDSLTIPEAGGVATVTASLSTVSGQDVIVDLGFTGDATPIDDYTNSGAAITIAAGSTSGSITITAVNDDIDDDDEAVNVDITGATNATEDGVQQVTVTIADDDDPPPAPPGVTPLNASFGAPTSTNLTATFTNNINGETATAQTFVVHAQGGRLLAADATITTTGTTVTLDPIGNFFAGENVQATVTSGIQEVGGAAIIPQVWQFQLAAGGSAEFSESGQTLGDPALNTRSWDVALGDVDGDGDLDAFMGNLGVGYGQNGAPNRLYLNDGTGVFTDSGQSIGDHESRHPSLGDMDGDGDLDVVVPNDAGEGNRIWENDGNGVFTERQVFGSNNSEDLALADLDGDGDLDVYVANNGQGNRVWRNDGGTLADSGQALGNHISGNVALGDLDNDGDIDAYVVNSNQNSRMWINDGNGQFTDSGQLMGSHFSESVALGDLDGDGDLDVWVANNDYASRVWMNNGSGEFVDSGQQLFLSYNTSRIEDVELGDLDGDGDLDAFTVNNNSQPTRVWANDGSGVFSDFSGTSLDINTNSLGVALGDVNGDGSLDAVVANDAIFGNTNSPGRVWFNQVLTPSVTLSIDNTTLAENGGAATVTATLSAAFASDVTVDLGFGGTAGASDYTASGTQIVISAGSTSGAITITANDDAIDEPDETVVIEMTGITNGQGSGQVTATILDDDEPVVPDVSISVDNDNIPEEAGVAMFNVLLSEATTLPVTVDLLIGGTAQASDYTISGTQVVVAAGATSGAITVTAVQDTDDEDNETVVVDISAVTNGNEDGTQQATTTIIDDDGPASFAVSALNATSTGFVVQFNADLDAGDLNLYDTSANLGAADVVLTGAAEGNVTGSVVVDPSLQMITFIASEGVLVADNYTATLRSAADGFEDSTGRLLDGNADGTAGDDYSSNFTIAASAAGTVTLSLPNVVRGPGQDVNVPADAAGLPLTISEGAGVRNVAVSIDYDANLLSVTGATVGAQMPAGATVAVDTSVAGTVVLTFTSPTDLPAGSNALVNLTASVPQGNASAIYRTMQVLDIHSASVTDASSNSIPVLDDDALQVTEFFADVSGNGRVNAADASQTAQFAALLIDGFAASPLADPIVVGDVSGNGRINAADASQVAQFAALIPVPTIPPIPAGVVVAGLATTDLGHGLPGILTIPQQAVDDPDNPPVGDSSSGSNSSSSSALSGDHLHPAIDHAFAELDEPGMLGQEEALWLELEVALDELLSPSLLTD